MLHMGVEETKRFVEHLQLDQTEFLAESRMVQGDENHSELEDDYDDDSSSYY